MGGPNRPVKARLQDLPKAVTVPDIDGEMTPELEARITRLGYAVFNAWASRNGYQALPDRRGLNEVNKYRRTASMLSSAMRESSTAHLMPHKDQALPHWKDGGADADVAFNIGYMALREAKRVLDPKKHAHRIHLLDRVRYDFGQHVFVDSKGRGVSAREYDSVLS